jgi:hypothetical protein
MGAVQTSDWIALIALAISLLSAGWTFYQHFRWARPVVKVSGQQWIHGTSWEPGVSKAGFSIDVTNVGDQSTQILKAYWQIDRGDGMDFRVSSSGPESVESRAAQPDDGFRPAPTFPFTLERYQSRGWDFAIDMATWRDREKYTRSRIVVEHTSRKSREVVYGDWEPSQVGLEAIRKLKETPPDAGERMSR